MLGIVLSTSVMALEKPPSLEEVKINKAHTNISKEEIRALNPMYRQDVIPAKANKAYPLVLPEEMVLDFIDNSNISYLLLEVQAI